MADRESLRSFRGRIRSIRRAPNTFSFSDDEWEMLKSLPELLSRPREGVCARCNGMGGIYVPSNGGRTFVKCPECKGKARG